MITVEEAEDVVLTPREWRRREELLGVFGRKNVAVVLLGVLLLVTMVGVIFLGLYPTNNPLHQILVTTWFFLATIIGVISLVAVGTCYQEAQVYEEAPRLQWAMICLGTATAIAVLLEILVWTLVMQGPDGLAWLFAFMLIAFVLFGAGLALLASVPLQAARNQLIDYEYGTEASVPAPPLTPAQANTQTAQTLEEIEEEETTNP
jgi:hypothetical protein